MKGILGLWLALIGFVPDANFPRLLHIVSTKLLESAYQPPFYPTLNFSTVPAFDLFCFLNLLLTERSPVCLQLSCFIYLSFYFFL